MGYVKGLSFASHSFVAKGLTPLTDGRTTVRQLAPPAGAPWHSSWHDSLVS